MSEIPADGSVLGEVEVLHGPTGCRQGRCTAVRVTCPDVAAPARAWVKVQRPPESTPGRGTVVFLVGGSGAGMYETHFVEGRRVLESVRHGGFRAVQICWIDSWLAASPGEFAGPKRLACRSASLARWVFQRVHRDEAGAREDAAVLSQGRTYRRALEQAGSPYVTEDVVPRTGHHVPGTPEGARRIRDRILEPHGTGG